MPTYKYECEDCRYSFECKQGIKDGPITKCPECEGKVRRIIHPSTFFLKTKTHPQNPNLRQAPEGHWIKDQ